MTTPADRLRHARVAAGYDSAVDACTRFGWGYSTYASHENGARAYRIDAARNYAKAYNTTPAWLLIGDMTEEPAGSVEVISVPLIGEVAAGLWVEVENMEFEDRVVIPAIPDARFPADQQFGLRVRGSSMNKVVKDGAFVIAVHYHAARNALDGDIVVVRRTRAGMIETTLKRFRVEGNLKKLVPESDDPRYQQAIKIAADEDETMVEIMGLVLGVYQPLI